jgi:putative cardiolipin synthase
MLLDELRRAAERGVRVRLLLDDNGIAGLDGDLAALDALPNVEVRLFNPFILRTPKWLGYAFDFVRLNRRMHNKSFTADGALSIVGGRNIGDTYFGLGEGAHFIDTDILVAGEVVSAVGAEFDRYWASGSAHPAERILAAPAENAIAMLAADAGAAANSPEGALYIERLRRANIVDALRAGSVALEWTTATLVSDDPAKGLGRAEFRDLLFPQLMELLERPDHSVDLVSAYFIPGRQFTEALADLARSGTRVRVLTNSLDATDVTIVHSAYVKYRRALLRGGVELYELKPGFAANDEERPPDGVGGSSRSSLHSKTMAVDERRIFIGSFNFDPRSLRLNTEMGVLVESRRMAEGLARSFAEDFPAMSYRPALNEDGSIRWDETNGRGAVTRHDEEPGVTLLSRLVFSLLALLPIEWLL